MKNEELFMLNQAITTVGNLSGVKFAYAIAKNKKVIETEIEVLKESVKPSEKFTEYEKKKAEIVKKYADKDEKGNYKADANNQYVVETQKVEFEKEVAPLNEEYKEEIDKRDAQVKEFNEVMLKAEAKFIPFKIKKEDVPVNITVAQTTAIFSLIEE